MGVLQRDLTAYYQAFRHGAADPLPPSERPQALTVRAWVTASATAANLKVTPVAPGEPLAERPSRRHRD